MPAPRSPVSPSWEVAAGEPALDRFHTQRSPQECDFREACPIAITLLVVLVVALTLLVTTFAWAGSARAQSGLGDVPIGGFQPWVAFTLTTEFSNENQRDLFFVAQPDATYRSSRAMPNAGSPLYAVGLLDSGSQVSLLTDDATQLFDIEGQGFAGTEFIEAQGVSGSEFLQIQDPLGIFAAGLQNAASGAGGATLTVPDTTTLRGLTSNSPASAPAGSVLPNVIGLPMMTTHTTVIRNSQPNFVQSGDTLFRSPSVEFLPLTGGVPADFTRRAALSLDIAPTVGGTEPFYTFNINNALNGESFTENPSTPTAIAGAFFTDIDLSNDGMTRTAEVFFDTGAQVTVVNELLAAQLGFDVVNDEPDFTVPIIGVGGAQSDIPGFVADSLTIPAVGGNFTANQVPIVVLPEIPNPLGAGILDGILGTNVFWDRDLAIDPTGSRLWISDPVAPTQVWTGFGQFTDVPRWSAGRVAVATDIVEVIGEAQLNLVDEREVYRMFLSAENFDDAVLFVADTGRLDVFTDVRVGHRGGVVMVPGATLTAVSITVEEEGFLGGGGRFEAGSIDIYGRLSPLAVPQNTMVFAGGLVLHESSEIQTGANGGIVVEGSATIGGELDFVFRLSGPNLELYGPATTIVAADTVVGRFDQINFFGYEDGLGLAVAYEADIVTAVLALLGDANLNQQVEQADLDAVLTNWGQSGKTWAEGDFDGDGFIAQADLDAVLTNWGSSVAPIFAGFDVPEPTALGVFACVGLLTTRRRAA